MVPSLAGPLRDEGQDLRGEQQFQWMIWDVGVNPCWSPGLTLTEGVLLVQVEVGVNVGVLMMMRRHAEHLQPGGRVSCYGGHPLGVKALCGQSLSIIQLWAKGGSRQRHPLPLQVVQPGMKSCKGMRRSRHVGETQSPMPGQQLHGVG